MPFRELRNSVNDGNFGDVLSANVSTVGNTPTTILGYGTQPNSVTFFVTNLVAKRTDGTSGDGAVVRMTACWKNVGGVLTQVGTDAVTVVHASSSLSTASASTSASGSVVNLRVVGVNAVSANWTLQSAFVIYTL